MVEVGKRTEEEEEAKDLEGWKPYEVSSVEGFFRL
jgi:hypothetical protein